MGKRLTLGAREIGGLLLAVILLGLAWRCVRYALGFPLWGDEAFVAVNFQVRDWASLFQPTDYRQIVPLGFMEATLASVRLFGINEYSLRLVSFLECLASLGLFAWFARRVLGRRESLIAVAIFAASYYVVRHGTEVKPYAGDLLVALVLLVLGWNVIRRPRMMNWALLTTFGIVAAWLSYTSIFITGAIGLALVLRVFRSKQRGEIAGFLAFAVLVPASFAFMMAVYGRPQASDAQYMWEIDTWKPFFPPLGDPRAWLPWLWKVHAGNMLAYPIGGPNGWSMLTLVLAVIGSVRLWKLRQRALLGLLLWPLALLFAASVMGKYPYGGSARVTLFMAPAFCVLAGVGVTWLLQRLSDSARGWALRAVVAVMCLLIVGGIVMNVHAPYKEKRDRENRRALAWLGARVGSGDCVVSFNSQVPVRWAPCLDNDGGTGAAYRFYLVQDSPVPVRWAPRAESVGPLPGGCVWLVAFRHKSKPFPEDKLAIYVGSLSVRFGEPTAHSFPLGDRDNGIRVWQFPAAMPPAPAAQGPPP